MVLLYQTEFLSQTEFSVPLVLPPLNSQNPLDSLSPICDRDMIATHTYSDTICTYLFHFPSLPS
jgi:hypothetical protein